jgi:hypothetical protein
MGTSLLFRVSAWGSDLLTFQDLFARKKSPGAGIGGGDRLVWRPHAADREVANWLTRRCRPPAPLLSDYMMDIGYQRAPND